MYPRLFVYTMHIQVLFKPVFHLALLILFGFGLQALCHRYVEVNLSRAASLSAHLKKWWEKSTTFDRLFAFALCASVALGVLAWALYGSSRKDIEAHLQQAGFEAAKV